VPSLLPSRSPQASIDNLQARAAADPAVDPVLERAGTRYGYQGSKTMADLQSLAGSIAGLRWARDYLWQTGIAQGMDPGALQALMQNYNSTLADYQSQLGNLQNRQQQVTVGGIPKNIGHFAEGGVFRAGNHNTPLHGDVRWGDGNGEELGVMLNNKVLHTLRDQGFGKQHGRTRTRSTAAMTRTVTWPCSGARCVTSCAKRSSELAMP
jgi:hypothetical protein